MSFQSGAIKSRRSGRVHLAAPETERQRLQTRQTAIRAPEISCQAIVVCAAFDEETKGKKANFAHRMHAMNKTSFGRMR